ncbi:MAG: hypothetical protein HQL35_15220 [Alphaproteobacteria bacterium]|nr:hypothetical protein [Alphaproteobacteria bacterium]
MFDAHPFPAEAAAEPERAPAKRGQVQAGPRPAKGHRPTDGKRHGDKGHGGHGHGKGPGANHGAKRTSSKSSGAKRRGAGAGAPSSRPA